MELLYEYNKQNKFDCHRTIELIFLTTCHLHSKHFFSINNKTVEFTFVAHQHTIYHSKRAFWGYVDVCTFCCSASKKYTAPLIHHISRWCQTYGKVTHLAHSFAGASANVWFVSNDE